MDRIKLAEYGKKYGWTAVILLIGIVLLLIPGNGSDANQDPGIIESMDNILSLEEALSEILSTVQGAGKVRVMLSVASGEETIYQNDTNTQENGSGRQDTVIVSDSDRNELGLVKQINPPVYRGAIVVCQGADSPVVRLAVTEAVATVTGLTSDKISILKMK